MDPEDLSAWSRRLDALLGAQFDSLPAAGTPGYWRRLQPVAGEAALPLEVLARCLRERYTAGYSTEAHRIFRVLLGRVQRQVGEWSATVASHSAAARRQHVQDDLAQECYLGLWQSLTAGDFTMWGVAFRAKMASLQSHTAHQYMERSGFWTRPGVSRPTHVPADVQQSLEAPGDGSVLPLSDQLVDADAGHAFDHVEYSDLIALMRRLSAPKRIVVYWRFWQGRSQEEIAKELRIAPRTVRDREKRALGELRSQLQREGGLA
jgi:RNA polymerase sigma factor (sigma-70 family)